MAVLAVGGQTLSTLPAKASSGSAPDVIQPLKNDTSPALRTLQASPVAPGGKGNHSHRPLRPGQKGTGLPTASNSIQTTVGAATMPSTSTNFEGVNNIDGVLPPDTNGDVGPNHYVQWVNLHYEVFDRTGKSLLGPSAGNTLWSGFGGVCDTTNQGDPVVRYDRIANRWVFTQFAFNVNNRGNPIAPYVQCFAVSTSGDPTGTYYRYAWTISNTYFPDYPKLAVWPDAYYMTVNYFNGLNFVGGGAIAFDRSKMLNGQAATGIGFGPLGIAYGGLLPSDLDGSILPLGGTPNYFGAVDTSGTSSGSTFQIWKFHVDFTTPANSTFGTANHTPNSNLAVGSYFFNLCGGFRNCIQQPASSQGLDAIADRLMNRLQYRRFADGHESLVANHTVGVGSSNNQAAIRWYEIRGLSATPMIYQQGTYSPSTDNRWMGSIAMDQAGDIALGYSVSSSTISPSIRYTGRVTGDPLGSLPQGEATLIAGSGSQTSNFNRWGDYSMMAVDPADDCTFWYTQEYYAVTSTAGWQTRIGSFKFANCGAPICPTGWSCADVGNASPAGGQSLTSGTWTIQGGGADIWGSSDQFHLVWQSLASDGGISARVVSQSNSNVWAKAGVMLRQSSDPSSAFYAALVTPGNGIVVQYRTSAGATALWPASLAGTPPTYLQVGRVGSTFTAYTSNDGVTWTAIPGSSVTLSMSGALLQGLAVTSHNPSALSTVTIDTVNVSTTPPPPPPPPPCPSGWSCADLGNATPTGSQALSSGTWTIQGGGADIWGISDQFHFAWQSLASDGGISARVVSQTNSNTWAKAGVMLRQTSDPNSAFYAAVVTPGNGIVVQYRPSAGAAALWPVSLSGTPPAYLQVGRVGSTFTAYTSNDGVTWTAIPGSTVTLSMSGALLQGLAVTSHNPSALSTVAVDSVNISTAQPPDCPTGWSCVDLGGPSPAGDQSLSSGSWTIQGGGADIWGTSDQFHFVWQNLASDGGISARVVSQTNSNAWAKAGVMLRQTSDPNSAYYYALVTPGNGIAVQYRPSAGAAALWPVSLSGTPPAYLQVSRVGSTFTGYTSNDGVTWTAIPGSTVTLSISGALLQGLAVTSHNPGALSTVAVDSVKVSTMQPPPSGCPSGWSCADLGSPALGGSQSLSSGTWTIQGGGTDIWGTSDQFHFAWQSLASDGGISARVVSQTNSNAWAKAGVMLRQTSDPNSAYYYALVTPGNGIAVQYRPSAGAAALWPVSLSGTPPAYLQVSRAGSTFTGYTSNDGVTWTAIPGSTVTLSMSGALLQGLAVTSHNSAALSTVTLDTVKAG